VANWLPVEIEIGNEHFTVVHDYEDVERCECRDDPNRMKALHPDRVHDAALRVWAELEAEDEQEAPRG
jgi:hypothetical protein